MSEPTIDPACEAAYVSGQARPHWPATIAGFVAKGEAAIAAEGVEIGLAYGAHPRARFDRFPATGAARAVVVFLHPGYWQMRDRTQFRFLAPVFTGLGCDFVVADYPLAPESSVAAITETVRGLVPAVAAGTRARRGRRLPIVAAGHSAGAHLAVELALAGGDSDAAVAAVIALSGVYDLEPLVATSLDRALRLDAATARAASPIHRVGAVGAPALFAVGGGETAAFVTQTRAMAAAWGAAGHAMRVEIVGDDDHFSLLAGLLEDESALGAAIAETIATAVGAG